MKKRQLWILAAIFVVFCGWMAVTCRSGDDKKVLSPTEDSSQFVTLTDAVPDAILEIRYFGTYNDGVNYGGTSIKNLVILEPVKTARN